MRNALLRFGARAEMFTGSKCATRTVRIASPSCTFRVQSENSASAMSINTHGKLTGGRSL